MSTNSTNPLISDDGFRKSKHSMNGSNCVEFRPQAGSGEVRDTQNRAVGHLAFPATEWNALVTAASLTTGRAPGH